MTFDGRNSCNQPIVSQGMAGTVSKRCWRHPGGSATSRISNVAEETGLVIRSIDGCGEACGR
jgi:hypothetical protein